MDEATESGRPPRPWIRNNLVALGSAAVFSVYSAGYFRTRAAADRFAGETVERRNAATAPATPEARLPTASVTVAHASSPTHGVIKPSSSVHAASSKPSAQTVDPPVAAVIESSPPAAQPKGETPPVAASTPAPTPAPTPVPAAAALDSSAKASETKDDDGLKNGVFSGWGTSRHGDIQASVEIKDGRIVGAYISQCLTRYSCSWISMLPGQVVSRQSAEVDYVSGATQSSNAFYYAIAEALKKAK